ncbi:hypothetical protein C2G38_2175836 [Gigaspora rosea]|uniref:Uncharacterized protein n=1 Tax=Gigaspora rosea TaxID=44941 RepID=A0A397VL25_9GLOM|nr:hypothetical protein C2G38_2175836 [Gigaspora rosea]
MAPSFHGMIRVEGDLCNAKRLHWVVAVGTAGGFLLATASWLSEEIIESYVPCLGVDEL